MVPFQTSRHEQMLCKRSCSLEGTKLNLTGCLDSPETNGVRSKQSLPTSVVFTWFTCWLCIRYLNLCFLLSLFTTFQAFHSIPLFSSFSFFFSYAVSRCQVQLSLWCQLLWTTLSRLEESKDQQRGKIEHALGKSQIIVQIQKGVLSCVRVFFGFIISQWSRSQD